MTGAGLPVAADGSPVSLSRRGDDGRGRLAAQPVVTWSVPSRRRGDGRGRAVGDTTGSKRPMRSVNAGSEAGSVLMADDHTSVGVRCQ